MSHAHPAASTSALTRAADDGRLGEFVAASSPARAELDAAARRYTRPLQVQVRGRPGTGRDTLARALRERLSITAIGPGEGDDGQVDADLWVYLLTGPPRRADHQNLATLPTDRTIVVLGKADIHGDPAVADRLAARCADQILTPVYPVSPLLACVDLRDDEFDFLRRLVAAGEEMPSMAAQFPTATLAGRPTPAGAAPFLGDERALRAGLLRRVDQHGLERALDLIADHDPAGAAVDALNDELRAMGRMTSLLDPVRQRIASVRHWRALELRAQVARIAARGHDRDTLEYLLAGEAVPA
ncbi:hypothetical protein AAFP30_10590 [Gordonia sp. CPCC 205515]|uniref:hypothetical protein n=1 Tax=Gordonia sp. CPCC 205515 TaxID=3140791 RepID=UPI003AF3C112